MNPTEALQLLVEEYPSLDNKDTKITKQFIAADGRVYNSFLVESTEPGFEKFIAKSFVHNPESLKREWLLLKLLQEKKAHAPRLLAADNEPKRFLLMEYIDGIPASQAVKLEDYDMTALFRGVGVATGMANSVELATFGNILEPSPKSWKDQVLEKLDDKLQTVKLHVAEDFFHKLTDAVADTKHVLDTETQGKPMLVHHDIYLENFLVKKADRDVVLIDYGIAYGGRPLFDLAKFYIWDLAHYPEQKDNFLNAYSTYVTLPLNFNEVMKFYLIYECLGMIAYFDRIGAIKDKNDAVRVLKDVVHGEGAITELLK